MNEAEIRVNAMIAEFSSHISMLSGRAAHIAAELATAQAKLKAMSEPKPTADVVPIKGSPE